MTVLPLIVVICVTNTTLSEGQSDPFKSVQIPFTLCLADAGIEIYPVRSGIRRLADGTTEKKINSYECDPVNGKCQ